MKTAKNKHLNYNILGIKLKIKQKNYELKREIEILKELVNENIDISKIKPIAGELREYQLMCNEILKKIKKICIENDLKYWLDSGTLLGAVRHKGFIPWDDDVDVCMPREDYNKIFSILQKTFENDKNFYLRERDLKDNNFQIRIRHRQINIGLDIFPVDCYYKSDLTEKEKEEANKKISLALKILNKKYKRRKKLNIEKIHKAKKDIIKIQKEIILDNKTCSSEYPALFFGIDYPSNAKSLIFNNNIVFPLKEILFEGEFYSSPNNTDEYLKNFYTDYMKFPEHFCY